MSEIIPREQTRMLRLAGHVTRIAEKRTARTILDGTPKEDQFRGLMWMEIY
jgi:hypothetical protein